MFDVTGIPDRRLKKGFVRGKVVVLTGDLPIDVTLSNLSKKAFRRVMDADLVLVSTGGVFKNRWGPVSPEYAVGMNPTYDPRTQQSL